MKKLLFLLGAFALFFIVSTCNKNKEKKEAVPIALEQSLELDSNEIYLNVSPATVYISSAEQKDCIGSEMDKRTGQSYAMSQIGKERRARDNVRQVSFKELEQPEPEPEPEPSKTGWIAWLTANWMSILGVILAILALGETIARLTPTEKDDAFFKWIRNLLNTVLPNFKKGGGTHP